MFCSKAIDLSQPSTVTFFICFLRVLCSKKKRIRKRKLLTVVCSVVFVHGLRGDAYKTWSSDKICWPRDLLPLNLENARVITVRLPY